MLSLIFSEKNENLIGAFRVNLRPAIDLLRMLAGKCRLKLLQRTVFSLNNFRENKAWIFHVNHLSKGIRTG